MSGNKRPIKFVTRRGCCEMSGKLFISAAVVLLVVAVAATAFAGIASAKRIYVSNEYTTIQEVFSDPLNGSSYNNDNHNITFVEGYIGLCAKFVGDDSYVRYPGNILPADKGSIEFYWKPPENIYELYSYRHEEWTDFGSYKPLSAGFLLDNIGWRAAPVGSFSLELMPIDWKNPDSPISWIGWSMWSGSAPLIIYVPDDYAKIKWAVDMRKDMNKRWKNILLACALKFKGEEGER